MTTLKQRALAARELINVAKATVNPFKASDLKKELEPVLETLVFDAITEVESQAEKIRDLQKQIGRLDARLGQLGG